MYALKLDKNGSKDVCSKEDFAKVIDKNLIEQIDRTEKFKFSTELKYKYVLWNQCDFIKIQLFPESVCIKKQISSSGNER